MNVNILLKMLIFDFHIEHAEHYSFQNSIFFFTLHIYRLVLLDWMQLGQGSTSV